MKKALSVFLISLCSTVGTSQFAQAAEPSLEGKFSDWTAYSRTEGGDKICYVLSSPTSKSPASVRHGDIYVLISSWKSGAATEQPSFLAGYPLRTTSAPVARVGSARFPMYISENEAFIEDNDDERRLIRNMRAGSVMRIQAMSARGTSVSYEFSLKGVTAALKKAKDACK